MVKAAIKHSRFRASFNHDPLEWAKFKDEGRGFGTVGALHKGSVAERPFRFFNELVSGAMAQALRLPMPPFALTWIDEKHPTESEQSFAGALFSSIDFNYERETPPRPDFDILNERFPSDCAGVLLFDILIANPDRSADNIWCDNSGAPTRFFIYDHDYALLGGEHDGIERIGNERDRLGLRFGIDTNDYHPLLRRIGSRELLEAWYQRFYLIPDWFIDDACEKAAETIRLGSADTKKVQGFLKYRRRHLDDLVGSHRAQFSSVGDWSRKERLF